MIDEDLRRRLLDMAQRDSDVRTVLAEEGSLFDGYHPEMRAVHEDNAAALREIVDEKGWPDSRVAGEDGAQAAWTIAQHAIGMPDFQRFCLEQLQRAAAQGRIPAWHPAYLIDRICSFEGGLQIYGTQFDWDDAGKMSPLPMEDPNGVDARRAAVGLPPLAEITQRHRADIGNEPTPADLAARRAQMEEWAREVGWR